MTDLDATNVMEVSTSSPDGAFVTMVMPVLTAKGLTRAAGKTFSSLQEMNKNMEPIQEEEESILEQLFTRLVELFRL